MKKLIWLLLAIIIIMLPFMIDDYFLNIAIMVILYAYLSQSWNIMSGYSGQFSFGHAVFFGQGAYVSTVLLTKYHISPWIGMFAGAGVASLTGLFIGYISFRYKLKGIYFSLATLAFAEIFRVLIENLAYFNKTLGIMIPLQDNALMFQFSSRIYYYYILLIMILIITGLVFWISKSRLGYNLIAIRENESAAQSLGVNTFRNKIAAICLSSALTALGGTFYAQYILYIKPASVFASDLSINILLPAIVGGVGTVFGPIVGALIVIPLGEITKSILGDYAGANLVAYGILLIVIITYMPDGVTGKLFNKRNKKKTS
jgi:branched-chain amino acid transport system permease protein